MSFRAVSIFAVLSSLSTAAISSSNPFSFVGTQGPGLSSLSTTLRSEVDMKGQDHLPTVAVLDSGFDANNLKGFGGIAGGYVANPQSNDLGASIMMGGDEPVAHGSHVGGIVLQNNGGKAFHAVKVGQDSKLSTQSLVNGIQHVQGLPNVRVVNISYHLIDRAIIQPIINLARSGKIVVLAAGNESSVFGKGNLIDTQIKEELVKQGGGRILLVGAQQQDKMGQPVQMRQDSNKAGSVKDHYITALGDKVISVMPGKQQIGEMSGTSMAAPAVTGVLDKMLRDNPSLTADEAVRCLYDAAQKTQNPEIFGQGILDPVATHKRAAAMVIEKERLEKERLAKLEQERKLKAAEQERLLKLEQERLAKLEQERKLKAAEQERLEKERLMRRQGHVPFLTAQLPQNTMMGGNKHEMPGVVTPVSSQQNPFFTPSLPQTPRSITTPVYDVPPFPHVPFLAVPFPQFPQNPIIGGNNKEMPGVVTPVPSQQNPFFTPSSSFGVLQEPARDLIEAHKRATAMMMEKERLEKERLERERFEQERKLKAAEQERLLKLEQERLAKLEQERKVKAEQERLEQERLERERFEQERKLKAAEQDRLEKLANFPVPGDVIQPVVLPIQQAYEKIRKNVDRSHQKAVEFALQKGLITADQMLQSRMPSFAEQRNSSAQHILERVNPQAQNVINFRIEKNIHAVHQEAVRKALNSGVIQEFHLFNNVPSFNVQQGFSADQMIAHLKK